MDKFLDKNMNWFSFTVPATYKFMCPNCEHIVSYTVNELTPKQKKAIEAEYPNEFKKVKGAK